MLTVQRCNETEVEASVLLRLEIQWGDERGLRLLLTSIDEALATNNLASTGSFRALDEEALLTAVKRGQRSAFDELWSSHANRLFLTAYRITRNREDAENAMQDALLNAFFHIRFDGRSSFMTWLRGIAMNAALMILRKNRSARCAFRWMMCNPGLAVLVHPSSYLDPCSHRKGDQT